MLGNQTESDGTVDPITGKVKQADDTLTQDDEMGQGSATEAAGAVETAIGQTLRKAFEAIPGLGKATTP